MSADLDLDVLQKLAEMGHAIPGHQALALLDRVKTAEAKVVEAKEAITAAWVEQQKRDQRANRAEARLAKVQALRDDLDRRGCLSCSSMTGGDALADYLREALGGEQHG